MTPPIETLMSEHRFIEKLLGALSGYVHRLGAGAPREDLARFVDILRNFADACHHGKEEDILFQAMVESGVPREGGPIAVMLHEHELGRAEVQVLANAAAGDGPFTEAEKESVSHAAAAYVELLRVDIQKEDQILFPMAEQVLPRDEWESIGARFEAFEEQEIGSGVHERLHGIGERLAEKYCAADECGC